jgi:predicted N-acetyltransferase YhbS
MTAARAVVRPMREADLAAADRIFRLAFGTYLGLPDPMQFAGDADWIGIRWRLEPAAAFVAELDGAVVGSVLAVHWGSLAFFGPVSVRPDLWDRGIARLLLEPVMARFAEWRVTHAGLFTFSQSAKHVGLYGRFGFYPRFLTAIMAKPVVMPGASDGWSTFSSLSDVDRAAFLARCRALASSLYPGLDPTAEIAGLVGLQLGDAVLTGSGDHLTGMALCHAGARSEAGSGTCYVKFAAVRPGPEAPEHFDQLLDACEAFCAARGMTTLVAGTNLAREGAYRRMLERGFRTALQGVGMHRPNEPCYSRPDVWAIDDWR